MMNKLFFMSCDHVDINRVKKILSNGNFDDDNFDINQRDEYGNNGIMIICRGGYYDYYLNKQTMKYNRENRTHYPLVEPFPPDDEQIEIGKLIINDPRFDWDNSENVLMYACEMNCTEIVVELLKNKNMKINKFSYENEKYNAEIKNILNKYFDDPHFYRKMSSFQDILFPYFSIISCCDGFFSVH